MKLTKRQLTINAAFCLALLGAVIWMLYAEYDRPWKAFQKEFLQHEQDITGKANVSEGIRQIWLEEFGEIDRCTTCHLGADRPDLEDLPQPYKAHSGDYLKHHPVEKFGCVVCHEGEGPALTVEAAHGLTEHWQRPFLKGPFAQASCSKCHFLTGDIPPDTNLAGGTAFINGARLFQKYSCIGCHKLRKYEQPVAIAPSLTLIGRKVSRDWLTEWLKDPQAYLPKNKMPRFRLSDKEIDYIADYILNIDPLSAVSPRLDGRPGDGENAARIKEGKALVSSLGCRGCHMINGSGSEFGPDLSRIGDKTNTEWLLTYLKSPGSYDTNSAMPPTRATDDEIRSIAAYLMSLKTSLYTSPLIEGGARGVNSSPGKGGGREGTHPLAGREEPQRLPEFVSIGEKIVKEQGCTGCHEIGRLSSRQTAPDLGNIGSKRKDELLFPDTDPGRKTLLSWLSMKVTEPAKFNTDKIVSRMPEYNFNKADARALVTFLAGQKKAPVPAEYTKALFDTAAPVTKGKQLIEKYNCLGCHRIRSSGGDIAPDLTEEAKKSRPEWLFSFLKSPHKIRPEQIMRSSMPDFELSDEEALSIVGYLSAVVEEPFPYNTMTKKEIPPEDIWDGEKLYKEVFACGACHAIDNHGGEVGPDHTDLASRLKRPWIERWLRDPQSIKPDVRMPRFKFEDWEFEALTNYIMTLGQYRFVTVKKSE